MKKLLLAVLVTCFAFTAEAFADEFSADVNSVMSGMTTTARIYYKDFKTFRTESMGVINISKGTNSYQLFEDTKKYVTMDDEDLKAQYPMVDADNFSEFVEKNDFKKVGTESVGGYSCDVYEGNITYTADQPPLAMKFWYSPKLDYPVKSQTQLPAPMSGTAVSTLENVKIGKQPDSLFEIPPGYTQVRSEEEAVGMGGFMMPYGEDGGAGTDEMPSQEEMQQMMEMMQQMRGSGQNQ